MKKIVLIILGLAIAAAIVVACGFSFTVSQRMDIDAPLDIVTPQVSSLSNWTHWYGAGVERLTRVNGGPVSIVVHDTTRSFEEAVAVLPKKDGRSTEIVWSRPMTIWQGVRGRGVAEMLQHLAALKSYIENPRSFYGFDIYIRPVTDTLFVVKEARIREAEIAAERPVLLRGLREYLRLHRGTTASDSVITGYESLSGGLVHLVVGIPVDKRGSEVDGIHFLTLPRGGRLLTGAGDSTRLGALRRAMDRYVGDKRLQLVAIPFTEEGAGGGYTLNYPIW